MKYFVYLGTSVKAHVHLSKDKERSPDGGDKKFI